MLARACKWHQRKTHCSRSLPQPWRPQHPRAPIQEDEGDGGSRCSRCTSPPPDKQVSAWLSEVYIPPSTSWRPPHTSYPEYRGLYPRSWAGTWPSVPAGRAPGRLLSPDGALSDLLSPPLCISPRNPLLLHLRLRWRHIDRKFRTANELRVSAQRDVSGELQPCRPIRWYNSYNIPWNNINCVIIVIIQFC